MSHVTDILLCTGIDDGGAEDEHPNADRLSEWLVSKHGAACKLVLVSDRAGGNKVMQADVFAVAVNHCSIPALIEAFRAIPWDYPEAVQLMVKDEHDDAFTIYTALE